MEKKLLTLRTETKEAHEKIRVRLVKMFTRHKDTLAAIGYDSADGTLSLCARFEKDAGMSTFKIDKRKMPTSALDFEIIGGEEDDAELAT